MGNIFRRGATPSEIENMPYHELKYWNSWHDLMEKEEEKAAEPIKKPIGNIKGK